MTYDQAMTLNIFLILIAAELGQLVQNTGGVHWFNWFN